ncbi:hypothetical protein DQ04_03711030 [Trypanosoma grayi]|uniref:hypothetical protein n=1 Tax=Trypanosoma grayi TaxID=71804 RepID=UPI0004F42DD6|nr:hypothetical protein DQ04_03711030 [Trypanosoma grayi]KEG10441.1 hypothetical protein DQ04_03711030 [Trypanosoma grayi]
MCACFVRLSRTLKEAQSILGGLDENEDASVLDTRRAELLKRIRRLGFLLSTGKQCLAAEEHLCDEAAASIVRSAEEFLTKFVSTHNQQCFIPVASVGLVCRQRWPTRPFAVSEPFLVHEDSRGVSVAARVLACAYHRDEPSTPRAAAPYERKCAAAAAAAACGVVTGVHGSKAPILSATESVHEQVMEDIRGAIKSMKEGAIRMSDLIQEERERLDANAELLQRGVDGATAESKQMDRLGIAFGGGSSLPRLLSGVPGAGMFWHAVVVPVWAVIRQAFFLCVIVALTGGVLLLMLTAPKTYAYAR